MGDPIRSLPYEAASIAVGAGSTFGDDQWTELHDGWWELALEPIEAAVPVAVDVYQPDHDHPLSVRIDGGMTARLRGFDVERLRLVAAQHCVVEICESTAAKVEVVADEVILSDRTELCSTTGIIERLTCTESVLIGHVDHLQAVHVNDVGGRDGSLTGSIIRRITLPQDATRLARIAVAAEKSTLFDPHVNGLIPIGRDADDDDGVRLDALLLLAHALKTRCPNPSKSARFRFDFFRHRQRQASGLQRILYLAYRALGYGERPASAVLTLLVIASATTVAASIERSVHESWSLSFSHIDATLSIFLGVLFSPAYSFDYERLPSAILVWPSWTIAIVQIAVTLSYTYVVLGLRNQLRPADTLLR